MLAIRLQRTGRSGHAQFRVIVQDSRFSPKRGRVVSYLGNYDPHTKTAVIDSEKAAKYLQNGAQPSDRVARLFKKEGIKLPDWVKLEEPKERTVRNPEKRRSTAPETPAETPPAAEQVAAEEPASEAGADEPAPEAPAEEETTAPETENSTEEDSNTEVPEETAKEEPQVEPQETPQPAAEPSAEKAEEK